MPILVSRPNKAVDVGRLIRTLCTYVNASLFTTVGQGKYLSQVGRQDPLIWSRPTPGQLAGTAHARTKRIDKYVRAYY